MLHVVFPLAVIQDPLWTALAVDILASPVLLVEAPFAFIGVPIGIPGQTMGDLLFLGSNIHANVEQVQIPFARSAPHVCCLLDRPVFLGELRICCNLQCTMIVQLNEFSSL